MGHDVLPAWSRGWRVVGQRYCSAAHCIGKQWKPLYGCTYAYAHVYNTDAYNGECMMEIVTVTMNTMVFRAVVQTFNDSKLTVAMIRTMLMQLC